MDRREPSVEPPEPAPAQDHYSTECRTTPVKCVLAGDRPSSTGHGAKFFVNLLPDRGSRSKLLTPQHTTSPVDFCRKTMEITVKQECWPKLKKISTRYKWYYCELG